MCEPDERKHEEMSVANSASHSSDESWTLLNPAGSTSSSSCSLEIVEHEDCKLSSHSLSDTPSDVDENNTFEKSEQDISITNKDDLSDNESVDEGRKSPVVEKSEVFPFSSSPNSARIDPSSCVDRTSGVGLAGRRTVYSADSNPSVVEFVSDGRPSREAVLPLSLRSNTFTDSDSDHSDFVRLDPKLADLVPESDQDDCMHVSSSTSRSSNSFSHFRIVRPVQLGSLYRHTDADDDVIPYYLDDRCESDLRNDDDLSTLSYKLTDEPITDKDVRRSYKHCRNTRLNDTLNSVVFWVLVLALGIGFGSFIATNRQMSHFHKEQVLRMKNVQDDLLMCERELDVSESRHQSFENDESSLSAINLNISNRELLLHRRLLRRNIYLSSLLLKLNRSNIEKELRIKLLLKEQDQYKFVESKIDHINPNYECNCKNNLEASNDKLFMIANQNSKIEMIQGFQSNSKKYPQSLSECLENLNSSYLASEEIKTWAKSNLKSIADSKSSNVSNAEILLKTISGEIISNSSHICQNPDNSMNGSLVQLVYQELKHRLNTNITRNLNFTSNMFNKAWLFSKNITRKVDAFLSKTFFNQSEKNCSENSSNLKNFSFNFKRILSTGLNISAKITNTLIRSSTNKSSNVKKLLTSGWKKLRNVTSGSGLIQKSLNHLFKAQERASKQVKIYADEFVHDSKLILSEVFNNSLAFKNSLSEPIFNEKQQNIQKNPAIFPDNLPKVPIQNTTKVNQSISENEDKVEGPLNLIGPKHRDVYDSSKPDQILPPKGKIEQEHYNRRRHSSREQQEEKEDKKDFLYLNSDNHYDGSSDNENDYEREKFQKLHRKLLTFNEELFYSADDDDLDDIYDDLVEIDDDVEDKDITGELRTWLTCQVRWWKSRLLRKNRVNRDLMKNCGPHLLRWQLKITCDKARSGSKTQRRCVKLLKSSSKRTNMSPEFFNGANYASHDHRIRPRAADFIQGQLLNKNQHPMGLHQNQKFNLRQRPHKKSCSRQKSRDAHLSCIKNYRSSYNDQEDHKANWFFQRAQERDNFHSTADPEWQFDRALEREWEREKPWYARRADGRQYLQEQELAWQRDDFSFDFGND